MHDDQLFLLRNRLTNTTSAIKSNKTAPRPTMARPTISELDGFPITKPPIDMPPENCLGPGPKATQLTITANEAKATIAAA